MYVIYPAEELLRIYENPSRQSVLTSAPTFPGCPSKCKSDEKRLKGKIPSQKNDRNREEKFERGIKLTKTVTAKSTSQRIRVRDRKEKQVMMQNLRNPGEEGTNPLKDLTHTNSNEPLKQHNSNAVKLVQIGE